MEPVLWTALLAPAALALGVRFAHLPSWALAVLMAAAMLAPPAALLVLAAGSESPESAFVWLPGPGLEVGLRADGLAAALSAVVGVTGLATLAHSLGYFSGSARRPAALAGLLAFGAAMQGLVLAADLLTLLFFWEIVGALSARLIAFQRDDPHAPAGAVRAFLTTRGADAGLSMATGALFAATGSLDLDASRPEGFLGAAVGAGLLLAAAGKSAQLPFQTWLSGAMAGPTPVSALLHSATMVAAGAYLLVRAGPLLQGWPLEAAAWLGVITALATAAFALAQRDLKAVLASSTSSQLGFMFLAAAVAPAAAVFHLVCHAAGKAGAFLATGAFQRRRNGTSLAELGGVGRQQPRAFLGFSIGVASIAAVPPLAAFWSKDAILVAVKADAAWYGLALLASALTAAYMLRAWLAVWRPGPEVGRSPAGEGWMLAGGSLLATGSVLLGAIHTPLAELLGEPIPAATLSSAGISLAMVGGGALLVIARLRPHPRLVAAAEAQLGTDVLLRALVQRPLLGASRGLDRADRAIDRAVDALGGAALGLARGYDRVERGGIDAGVEALGRGAVGLARGSDRTERGGIDRAVDGLAGLVRGGGEELPRLQSGQMYAYLRNTALGIAFLAILLALVAIA